MKTTLINMWLLLSYRLVLGGIFLVASVPKILDRTGFINLVKISGSVTRDDLLGLLNLALKVTGL
jgi:uncharacterized membrane protein YphA (DoxX/SURF4 family)